MYNLLRVLSNVSASGNLLEISVTTNNKFHLTFSSISAVNRLRTSHRNSRSQVYTGLQISFQSIWILQLKFSPLFGDFSFNLGLWTDGSRRALVWIAIFSHFCSRKHRNSHQLWLAKSLKETQPCIWFVQSIFWVRQMILFYISPTEVTKQPNRLTCFQLFSVVDEFFG